MSITKVERERRQELSDIGRKVCSKCKTQKAESEFYPDKRASDSLQSHCKVCQAEYAKANPEKIVKYSLKEGYCLYEAWYGDKRYIGSGKTIARRNKHLSGSARIARTLGTKATSFKVLVIGTADYCLDLEYKYILAIGRDNLLNKRLPEQR